MNVYAIRLPSTGPLCVWGWGVGGGACVRAAKAGGRVCVLPCLFCFIVGSLCNGSRDGALALNNFIP